MKTTTKDVTPKDFVKLLKDKPNEVVSAQIVPAKLGSKKLGKIRVEQTDENHTNSGWIDFDTLENVGSKIHKSNVEIARRMLDPKTSRRRLHFKFRGSIASRSRRNQKNLIIYDKD